MSSRFVTVTLIMLLLSLLAAVVGTGDYGVRSRNYRVHLEQSAAELEKLHVYSFLQPVVVERPEPLSVLDRGFEGWVGEIRIDLFSVPAAALGGDPGNDFMAGSADLDLTTIVQVVLGLLALLLTFDAIAGEKEAGTLKLVLASGLSRTDLAVGKFVGACLALLIPLLSGTALTLGVLFFRGGVALDALRWQRLAGLLAVYMIYLGWMVLVGLLISLRTRTTSSALVVSLLTWLAVVFLIPQTAGAVAGELVRSDRPRQEMRQEVREVEERRREELRRINAQDPRLADDNYGHYAPVSQNKNGAELRRYGTAPFYDKLARYYESWIEITRAYADRIFEVRRRHGDELRRAERRAELLFWLSPASLMERAAESLAGTSSADCDEHLAAVREFRRELIRYLDARGAFGSWRWFTDEVEPIPWTTLLEVDVDPDEVDETNYEELIERFSSPDIQQKVARLREQWDNDPERRLVLDDLPAFEDRPLDLSRAVERILPELSLLLLLELVFAAATLDGIRRYSPDGRDPRTIRHASPGGRGTGAGLRREERAAVRGTSGR